MTDLIVRVNEGKLRGKECTSIFEQTYYAFKGIPYAKPPVGELRFAIPEPPEPWEEVRDATNDCNTCPQLDKISLDVVGDEDCLYLNVYTPRLPTAEDSQMPVMVYFHGGGFVFGHGTDDSSHGPDYLVEKDVVVVSFNYRIGILGFLCLNHKEAPGNMGLRDQVEALKWVQKNIHAFGGDPSNVTVFGMSAGGASIEYLLLSPMAKGLFDKAIIQSGSTLLPWARTENMKELIMKMPHLKGKNVQDSEILQLLKRLPIKELISGSMSALAADTGHRGGIHFGFVPTVEKPDEWEPFLDRSPYELLSRGEFMRVPIMTGFCTREGLLILNSFRAVLEKLVKENNFFNILPFDIDEAQKTKLDTILKSLYLESDKRYSDENAFAIDFLTDVDFLGGIYISATLLSKQYYPVYLYEFSYDGKLNYFKTKFGIKHEGACHGDDGGYILKSDLLPLQNISDTDKLVRNRMVTLFTNFAKYGDPTPYIDDVITTKWEKATVETGMACLLVDDKLTMQSGIYAERMRLFQDLFQGQYAPQ